MGKSNLSQHEQYLQLLEKRIKEVCDKHQEVSDTFYKTLRDQCELHLRSIEKPVREIYEEQNELYDTFYKTLDVFNTARDMTMQFFVVADNLRTTRLEFEKENSDKENTDWKIRRWWK